MSYNSNRVSATNTSAVSPRISWIHVCIMSSLVPGEVVYSVSTFNDKNRENLTADVKDLMATSSKRLVLDVRGLELTSLPHMSPRERKRPSGPQIQLLIWPVWNNRGGRSDLIVVAVTPTAFAGGRGKTQPCAIGWSTFSKLEINRVLS